MQAGKIEMPLLIFSVEPPLPPKQNPANATVYAHRYDLVSVAQVSNVDYQKIFLFMICTQ